MYVCPCTSLYKRREENKLDATKYFIAQLNNGSNLISFFFNFNKTYFI